MAWGDKFGRALRIPSPYGLLAMLVALLRSSTRNSGAELVSQVPPAHSANNTKATARVALVLLVGVTRIELVTPTMSKCLFPLKILIFKHFKL